jgi:hypothetical protein
MDKQLFVGSGKKVEMDQNMTSGNRNYRVATTNIARVFSKCNSKSTKRKKNRANARLSNATNKT